MEPEFPMTYTSAINSRPEITGANRPLLTSYDSGYEYSLEHWIDLQREIEEADEEVWSAQMELAVAAV